MGDVLTQYVSLSKLKKYRKKRLSGELILWREHHIWMKVTSALNLISLRTDTTSLTKNTEYVEVEWNGEKVGSENSKQGCH